MKNRIKKNTNAALLFAALFLSACVNSFAQGTPQIVPTQTEQLYVISSKAGGVSEIEGDVKVKRAAATAEAALVKGDALGDKDRVFTGINGRAEVLLNPGSYLRVGENAEFELTSTTLDALQIRLVQGSAIIEANTVGGEKGANVSIVTGQTVVRLEKSGLYRINATGTATELYVWEGAARVGNQIVKSGRRLTVGAGSLTAIVVKFDRSNLDALDLWSATRADELAKLNDRLRRVDLEQILASNSWNYNSSYFDGYWVFDRRTRTWCFVPYYGSRNRCCRAYGQRHSTAIAVKKGGNPVSVVYNPRKYDVSAVDVITRKSSGDSSDSSSGKSDYDYSSPPSKSDSSSSSSSSSKSDNSSSPSKSDSSPPPSKSDNSPPPSKKDNLR